VVSTKGITIGELKLETEASLLSVGASIKIRDQSWLSGNRLLGQGLRRGFHHFY
jgi:hypothetical protein